MASRKNNDPLSARTPLSAHAAHKAANRAAKQSASPSAGGPSVRAGAAKPGVVRIVGGQWRRRLLPVPVKDGLRPTPDRVRETLFNWLGQDLSGWHCLDAFAGTGALGFEAASRGAASVVMVEKDTQVARHLQHTIDTLGAQCIDLRRGDGLQALAGKSAAGATGWDVIFLDPPFATDLDAQALPLAAQAMAQEGFIYLESARQWSAEAVAEYGLALTRSTKAGMVHAHLLRKL